MNIRSSSESAIWSEIAVGRLKNAKGGFFREDRQGWEGEWSLWLIHFDNHAVCSSLTVTIHNHSVSSCHLDCDMNLSKAVGPLMFEVDSIVPTNPMVSSVLFTLPISPLMDLMVSSFVVLGLNGFVVLAEFVCPAVPCDLVAGLSWRLSVLAGDKCSEKTESNNLSDVHFEFVINRKI